MTTKAIAPGAHLLVIDISVDANTNRGSTYECILDGVSIGNSAEVILDGSAKFEGYLGDIGPIASTTQMIDDVVIYAH